MKPESGYYLAKAHADLSDARKIIGIALANVAARSAYYAVFHAAEALVLEKTGKVAKTHRGVRSEFARVTKDEPRIAKSMTEFLAQAYRYKEIGDYGVDPDEIVTIENAEEAIRLATDFLVCIEAILN
jgi:uncharacterized protein (UPF0332 family)